MPKWADYIITAIRYNNGHISHVWISKDNGESDMGNGTIWTKAQVISLLKANNTICTGKWAYTSKKWVKGAQVSYETRSGIEYLRTHPDYTETDNLENMLQLHHFGL